MKTPVNTKPITIEVQSKDCEKHIATSKGVGRATSTCSTGSAAFSLAMRWFFGSNLNSHGITHEERHAVTVVRLNPVQFLATLKPTESNKANEASSLPSLPSVKIP